MHFISFQRFLTSHCRTQNAALHGSCQSILQRVCEQLKSLLCCSAQLTGDQFWRYLWGMGTTMVYIRAVQIPTQRPDPGLGQISPPGENMHYHSVQKLHVLLFEQGTGMLWAVMCAWISCYIPSGGRKQRHIDYSSDAYLILFSLVSLFYRWGSLLLYFRPLVWMTSLHSTELNYSLEHQCHSGKQAM